MSAAATDRKLSRYKVLRNRNHSCCATLLMAWSNRLERKVPANGPQGAHDGVETL